MLFLFIVDAQAAYGATLASPLNPPECSPYNSTLQCYSGQNSCPFCNLFLTLQMTQPGCRDAEQC